MTTCTALLDANVLYPAALRDLFLQLSITGLFRVKWTADIHREWIGNLLTNEPHRQRAALERTRALMDGAVRDYLVSGHEGLISSLSLPDPDDRHILAAAIAGRCDVIVTLNLKDFPQSAIEPFGIAIQHPDAFLCDQLCLAQRQFCRAVRLVRLRLQNPPFTIDKHLDLLTRLGLVATATELRRLSMFL